MSAWMSFFRGVGSVLNIMPESSNRLPDIRTFMAADDETAIRSDWEKVGDDIRAVMCPDRLSKEILSEVDRMKSQGKGEK